MSFLGVGVYEIALTPEKAKWFLDNTPEDVNNRDTQRFVVDKYAADMVAGKWRPREALLLATEEGWLLNGKHTCLAVLKSGVTVTVVLTVEPSGTTVKDVRVDLQRPRSAAFLLDLPPAAVGTVRVLISALPEYRGSGVNAMPVNGIKAAWEVVGPEYIRLSSSTIRRVTQAPVKAAFVLGMLEWPYDRGRLLEQYEWIAQMRMDSPIWPSVSAVVRQLLERYPAQLAPGMSQREGTFLRMYKAISPPTRNLSKVYTKDGFLTVRHDAAEAASRHMGWVLEQFGDRPVVRAKSA